MNRSQRALLLSPFVGQRFAWFINKERASDFERLDASVVVSIADGHRAAAQNPSSLSLVRDGWESQGLVQLSLMDRNGCTWTSRHCGATRPGASTWSTSTTPAPRCCRADPGGGRRHLRLEAEIGGYEAARPPSRRVEHTYDALARLVGADRDDIAVVENATRAWDMAFYALPFRRVTGS